MSGACDRPRASVGEETRAYQKSGEVLPTEGGSTDRTSLLRLSLEKTEENKAEQWRNSASGVNAGRGGWWRREARGAQWMANEAEVGS